MNTTNVKEIGSYKNGNYKVRLFTDGTKIRFNNKDTLEPSFAESMDVKITNFCDMNCPMCHEGSTCYGAHGNILNSLFINSLHPYTEIAIGGGNPISHPDLVPFLIKLKKQKVIANITVNQKHFIEQYDLIKTLVNSEYVHGIGISYNLYSKDLIDMVKSIPNTVLHTILGVTTKEQYETLYDQDLRVLILGYKYRRRGVKFYSDAVVNNINIIRDNITNMFDHFSVLSFDNLAIDQLKLKQHINSDIWDKSYMGDDGGYTFYIDMVDNVFAQSSISDARYPVLNNVDDMFNVIRMNRI